MSIAIMSSTELDFMRASGKLAADLLSYLVSLCEPGVTTQELNDKAEAWTLDRGARSGPLGYRGFTRSICTSINEVVCHGIPCDRHLLEGDIINIDVSPVLNGFFGDTSTMVCIGSVSKEAADLVNVTLEALERGIAAVTPGAYLSDIGKAIQEYAEGMGYGVVRDCAGHGIGREFHTDPAVLHFFNSEEDLILKKGMVFTIEPMINIGTHEIKLLDDGWTIKTADGSLSAQAEHMIVVIEGGAEVLTRE